VYSKDGDEETNSDSDTEFEDDAKIQLHETVKVLASYHSIEEKRVKLEKSLGTQKFIEGYPAIQV
jgi:hypothetical protein